MVHRHTPDHRGVLAHECRVCGTALDGPAAVVLRLAGVARSARNPNICTRCDTHFQAGHILEVTVLFADLSGFTSLTRELGPERTHELVDAFLRRAARAVVAEDGYVDKFIGDAVMAVFNTPIERPDHAAAAFRAARAIHELMPELTKEHGRELHATIGIARGFARLGTLGGRDQQDRTLLGDVVNLAARLQARAAPGEIVVNDDVFRTLDPTPDAPPEEWLDLKGFPESIAARRFGTGPPAIPDLTPRRTRHAPVGLGAITFALLGAPCALSLAVSPIAVWLGAAAVATAGGAATLSGLDRTWIRLPMMTLSALLAIGNLFAVHHSSRLRRQRAHGDRLPPSPQDLRRTRWAIGLAVLTLLIAVAEHVAHLVLHPGD